MIFYQSNYLIHIFVLSLGLIFIIIPTASTSTGMSNTLSFYPDLFLCFIFSNILNRPNTTNLYIILFLMLFSDVLHMKPIGLLTILVLTSLIIIRRFEVQLGKSPFYIHYLIFIFVISCIQILNIFLHQLFFIPRINFVTIINQTFFTLICYPLFDIPYKLVNLKKR